MALAIAIVGVAGAVGLSDVAEVLRSLANGGQQPVLDGLLAVWHP